MRSDPKSPEDDPQLQHDVGIGETIPAEAAEKMKTDARAALEAALYRVLVQEAPEQLEGKSEAEIREILTRKINAVFLLHDQPLPPQPRN